jgi:hypothetical protein
MGQVADEFSLLLPLSMSQLYLGSDSNAAVLPEGGSNAAVPSAGTIRVSNLRGAVSSKIVNNFTLTFQANFAALQDDAALMQSFQSDVRISVAEAAGAPLSSVTILSVTSGSVKVAVRVRYPKAGRVNANVLPRLQGISSETLVTTIFGTAFLTKYSIANNTLMVIDATPPTLLTASKSLVGVKGSLMTVSVADMFASATVNADSLTYSLTSTTNPTPSNVSVNVSTGLMTVNGRYLNRTYAANVTAMGSNGMTSTQATVSVTEIFAPVPTLSNALGTASLSNNTKTYGLSNHFATATDTMPLYYWLTGNPQSNSSINAGVLSVMGANRGASYNVSVSASNAYGKSNVTLATLGVTEAAAAASGPAYFTRAGATGPRGPTLVQLQAAYTGMARMNGLTLYNNMDGFQHWPVPTTGTYLITVAGAAGAMASKSAAGVTPGKGGLLSFSTSLVQGDALIVSVGHTPPVEVWGNAGNAGGSGGGASYVVLRRNTTLTLLATAGGGGGGGSTAATTGQASGYSATVTQNETVASVLTRSHYSVGASYAVSISTNTNTARSWADGLTGNVAVLGSGGFGSGGGGSYWNAGGGGGGYNGGDNLVDGNYAGGMAGTNFLRSTMTATSVGVHTDMSHGYVTITPPTT